MNNEQMHGDDVTLSDDARIMLDRYLAEVRTLARGLRSVSVQDVTSDIRDHVFSSLRGNTGAIAAPQMLAALQRVGSADQWLPMDELPAWRRAARRIVSSPHLPYAAFALLVLGLMLPIQLMVVLVGASFCLARGALTQETPENRWQRWLLYPPLLVVYAVSLLVFLLWPMAAIVERPLSDIGLPIWMTRWTSIAPGQPVPISAGIFAVGVWLTLVAIVLTAKPAIVRACFYPFAERISRLRMVFIVTAGIITAVAGALILRG